jgi:RimJ/RimL family protein N-acetyltransferase
MLDPILLDIPDTFESDRLSYRVPRAGDGPATNAAIRESFDTLKPWMPWAQELPSLEKSEANCRRAWAQFLLREDMTLRIFLKSTGELIGSTGLHAPDWNVRKFMIGYWIGQRHEGNGYAQETVRAVANFAIERLKARRLELWVDPRNTKSARVAERAGFTLESIQRSHGVDMNGNLCDQMMYVRIV